MQLQCDTMLLRDEKFIHEQFPTGTGISHGRIARALCGKPEARDRSQQKQTDRKAG
jgi:hypothetical protein